MNRHQIEANPSYLDALVRSVESHYTVIDTITDDAGATVAYIVANEVKTHLVSVTPAGLQCECAAAAHQRYCCHRACVTAHLIHAADAARKSATKPAPVAPPAAVILPVMPTAAQRAPHLYR